MGLRSQEPCGFLRVGGLCHPHLAESGVHVCLERRKAGTRIAAHSGLRESWRREKPKRVRLASLNRSDSQSRGSLESFLIWRYLALHLFQSNESLGIAFMKRLHKRKMRCKIREPRNESGVLVSLVLFWLHRSLVPPVIGPRKAKARSRE